MLLSFSLNGMSESQSQWQRLIHLSMKHVEYYGKKESLPCGNMLSFNKTELSIVELVDSTSI